jgi:hypothetical protein
MKGRRGRIVNLLIARRREWEKGFVSGLTGLSLGLTINTMY